MGNDSPGVTGISVVVPVYSGAAFLERLVSRLGRLERRLEATDLGVRLLEAIFVLDEPVDGSREVLEGLKADRPWLRVIELSRNFGQHNATVAGILHSSGDWVVTLDEDGQHPPEAIPALLAGAAQDREDVRYATPRGDTHRAAYRNLASRTAKRAIAWLSGARHVTDIASFRLIRGQIARAAASVCSNETYFDMTLPWFTQRIGSEPMDLEDPRARSGHQSGYRFFSLLSHARRLVFSADIHFARLAVLVSGACIALAALLLLWVLLSVLLSPEDATTKGWASLMSVNLFFGGALALLLGLVLEFVRTSLFHAQGKPAFFVVDRGGDRRLVERRAALLDLAERLAQEADRPLQGSGNDRGDG